MNKRGLIAMPTTAEMRQSADDLQGRFKIPNCPLGVDGTHIRLCKMPSASDIPVGANPQDFYCRKNFYSLNVQLVGDNQMLIRNIETRWAGSTHDARVWRNSSAKEIMEAQQMFSIAGDSAYPMSRTLLKPFSNAEATTPNHRRFNRLLCGLRTVCTENIIGVWKQRFPILRMGFRTRLDNTMLYIRALAALHNMSKVFSDPLPEEENNHEDVRDDDQEEQEQQEPTTEAGVRIQGKLHRDRVFRSIFGNEH